MASDAPLDRLRTGHSLVVTIDGKTKSVVHGAEAYPALLDRVVTIERIQPGLADVRLVAQSPRGRGSVACATGVTNRVEVARSTAPPSPVTWLARTFE